MEVIFYTGKDYVKCQMQEQLFCQVKFPCKIEYKYIEEEGIEYFVQHGIMIIPSLIISNKGKKEVFSGDINPKDVQDALNRLV